MKYFTASALAILTLNSLLLSVSGHETVTHSGGGVTPIKPDVVHHVEVSVNPKEHIHDAHNPGSADHKIENIKPITSVNPKKHEHEHVTITDVPADHTTKENHGSHDHETKHDVIKDISTSINTTTSSLLEEARIKFDQIIHSVKSLVTTPKHPVTAHITVPKPLDSDSVVTVEPADCNFGSSEEFWDFFKDGHVDEKKIEKRIFCPEAIGYLKDLDDEKFTTKFLDNENISSSILAALMLRRVTLMGNYSSLYINTNYMTCFNALWDKVQSNQSEHWPCSGLNCYKSDIVGNFKTFTESTPSCKAVLKKELETYASSIADAAQSLGPADLREVILETMTNSPHLSLTFFNLYDNVMNMNKTTVADKIEKLMNYLKEIAPKLKNPALYLNAETAFKKRYEELNEKNKAHVDTENKAHVETVNNVDNVHHEDNAHKGVIETPHDVTEIKSKADEDHKKSGVHTEPTKTTKEPTKTALESVLSVKKV